MEMGNTKQVQAIVACKEEHWWSGQPLGELEGAWNGK